MIKQLSILFALIIVSTSLYAAQEIGNGTDDYRVQRHAWFKKATRGSFCVRVSKTFGTSNDFAKSAVREALSVWQRYIAENSVLLNDDSISSFNFSEHKACDGSEILRFELGTMPKAVSNSAKLGILPIAYPVLEHADSNQLASSGFIWVSSQSTSPNYIDWSSPNVLVAILIHELGHVLGCDHVPGTLMAANLSQYLAGVRVDESRAFLKQIDFQRQLVAIDLTRSFIPRKNCDAEVLKSYRFFSQDVAPDGFKDAWRILLGREPLLNDRTRISIEGFCTKLRFGDDIGEAVFNMELNDLLNPSSAGIPIFVRSSFILSDITLTNTGYSSLGSLQQPSKNGYSVVFRRNIDSPVGVDLIHDGHLLPLARAQTPFETSKGSR